MGAYVEYAKGGTDLRTKSTISCWVKRGKLGAEQYIWGWGENNSSDAYLRFDSGDNIECNIDGAGSNYNSTELFRDVNGWYHFVVSLDGANATANLRRRIWVNGVQLDDGNSAVGTFSAAVMGWHSSQDLWIGANPRQQQASAHSYFDGIISHFHYCSNYSYAASDFGEFDSTTGEWKIKTAPNVQYGSEGFFLKFENSSNMTLDSSGNNKSFNTSGTISSTKDNPSNVFCVMNPLQKPFATNDMSFENANTRVYGNNNDWLRSYGTLGANKGKWWYELYIGTGDTSGRVGWDSIDYINDGTDSYYSGLTIQQGNGAVRGGIRGTAAYSPDAVQLPADGGGNATFSQGDYLGMGIDLDNNTITIHKNGTALATNWSYNGYNSSCKANTYGTFVSPSVNWYSSSGNQNIYDFNFGNGKFGSSAALTGTTYTDSNNEGVFKYQPPTNYLAWCTKNLNA